MGLSKKVKVVGLDLSKEKVVVVDFFFSHHIIFWGFEPNTKKQCKKIIEF